MKPYTKILVPTDFSAHAVEALGTAVDIAARYGASITLTHVFEPIAYGVPEATGATAFFDQSAMIEDVNNALDKAKQTAITAGAKNVDAVQLFGFAPGEIAELAKNGGFDLIVMGTHGRRGFSHLLMGSVAERVVRIAHCPVLTVRAPQAKAA